MAKIKVRASNPGYPGRWRAGSRHWENGKEYVVEVIDDPPGGKPLTEEEPLDPETKLSDMTRISKAGVAALKADSHISVLEGDRSAEGGERSDTVLLRLITEQGRPTVKIGASESSSGLSFAGPTGTRNAWLVLKTEGNHSSLRLRDEDGREQSYGP